MSEIFCIKVAQQKLYTKSGLAQTPYTIFPFDRVYLARKEQAPLFKKLFRYYLSMPLDYDLYNALTSIKLTHSCTSTLVQDKVQNQRRYMPPPSFRKYSPNPRCDNAVTNIINIEDVADWIMVVPTHTYKRNATHKINYCVTKAVSKLRAHKLTSQGNLPRITLHTPDKEIPFMCATCSNIPAYYAAECSPGTYECRTSNNIVLGKEVPNGSGIQQ